MSNTFTVAYYSLTVVEMDVDQKIFFYNILIIKSVIGSVKLKFVSYDC